MGYDYTMGFLTKHAELVAKITRVATTGEVIAYDFEDWAKLRYAHQTVLSLLANISKNVQGQADIRQHVRCWTEHLADGRVRLNVGKPNHKMTGRPPGTLNTGWKDGYVPAEIAGGEYIHDRKVADDEEFKRFVGKVVEAPKHFHLISARFDSLPPDPVEYFNDLFKLYGWQVKSVSDTTLMLMRV